MDTPSDLATQLLRRIGEGDSSAGDELVPLLYDELHRLAKKAMKDQRASHTLQATSLVNEAWMRLVKREGTDWENRDHFLAVAARAMRSVLVDHARKRGAGKRSGSKPAVPLDEIVASFEERAYDLVELDDLIAELAKSDAELARIVELRFFAGLEHADVARVMGTSQRSVERGWRFAKAWLEPRIGPES